MNKNGRNLDIRTASPNLNKSAVFTPKQVDTSMNEKDLSPPSVRQFSQSPSKLIFEEKQRVKLMID